MAGDARTSEKLEKLARLKKLRSGLAAGKRSTDKLADEMPDVTEFESSPEPAAPDAPTERKRSATAAKPAPEPDSLSDYFEALGVTPPKEKAKAVDPDPFEAAVPPEPAQQEPGRDVRPDDLWHDPVRDSGEFMKGFSGSVPPDRDEPIRLGGASAPEYDAPVGSAASAAEREPEIESQAAAETTGQSTDSALDAPLTVSFDESRARLLQHVSDQMSCSVEDVVITAVDWYLDALFGEDGQQADDRRA